MHSDFLILGGGVVGLTSAQALLQAGYSVTLLNEIEGEPQPIPADAYHWQ